MVDCKLLWSVCLCKNDKKNGTFKNDYFIAGFGDSCSFGIYFDFHRILRKNGMIVKINPFHYKVNWKSINSDNPVICWFSGGITSAVACHIAIESFGVENCRVIFMDTKNEDDDLYRFKNDCSAFFGIPIETISNDKYDSIEDVWYEFLSLNSATGAICSSVLKRDLRLKFEKENNFSYQIFGFDNKEQKRANSFDCNYSYANGLYPLIYKDFSKPDCIRIVDRWGIRIPYSYRSGYRNNNCLKTGCIRGGAGYWMLIKEKEPSKYNRMAFVEHDLTNKKGKPVTMLRDWTTQERKNVFLLPHPDYPDHKDLSMMPYRLVKPLVDCNGYCGTNDFNKISDTENEIYYG